MRLNLIALLLLVLGCRKPPQHKDAGVSVDAIASDASQTDGAVLDATITDGHEDAEVSADSGTFSDANAEIASVVLSIQVDASTSCAPGGAQISGMKTEVISNATGGCIPVHVIHRRGGIPVIGEYDTNCAAPEEKPCFEVGDELLIRPIEPGGYHVLVTGIVGGTACYVGDASVGAAAGTATAQPLFLLRQAACSNVRRVK